MTLKEAAAQLGVTADNLRMQIRNGKLAAVKVGRDWHVTIQEVERYRDQNLGRWYRRAFPKDGFEAVLFRIMPSARQRSLDIRGIVAIAADEATTFDEFALRVNLHAAALLRSAAKVTDLRTDSSTRSIRMCFE